MDKLIFKMPKFAIEKYVSENFSEITVDDYLELVKMEINIPSYLYIQNVELLKNNNILKLIFEKNPEIRNNIEFMNFALQNNVNAIRYFNQNMLQYEVCVDAIKRGFIASEEDLIFNPELCDSAVIMEAAIKANPKLIKYVTKFCGIQLNPQLVADTLIKYKITEEDLINNPELCGIYVIISKYPEYKLYSKFLSESEKFQIIKSILLSKDFEKLKNLPFFNERFGGKLSGENAFLIALSLDLDYDEIALETNKKYSKLLDSLINGVIGIRYKNSKRSFIFPDIVSINNIVLDAFQKAKNTGNHESISELTQAIYSFINMDGNTKLFMTEDYIKFRLFDLYQDYILGDGLDQTVSIIFYNEILNKHRNSFCSREKEKIIEDIKKKLSLTDKKRKTIYNGRLIEKVSQLLVNKNFECLGIKEEDVLCAISEVEKELKNNKDLVKAGIVLNSNVLEEFKTLMLTNGKITRGVIAQILKIDNVEAINYIFKKYEQIKLRYINKISLSDIEKPINSEVIRNLGFNYNNFLMGSRERAIDNLVDLLLIIDNHTAEKIIKNARNFNEFKEILPLVNLFPEFTTNNIIEILENYSKISNKLNWDYDMDGITKIKDIILLANSYSSINDLYSTILGKEIVDKLPVAGMQEYFCFYLDMYKKYASSIPNVSGVFNDIEYESFNYQSSDRLLLGINCYHSCVDLMNVSGKRTYEECLLEATGDVIMMRDKKTGEFFARTLIFRRGNVIQLAKVYDKNGNNIILDDVLLTEIANQILLQSNKANDRIDYVFISAPFDKCSTKFPLYKNAKFESVFPHADFGEMAYLIGTSERVKNDDVLSSLDFAYQSNASYKKERQPISFNPQAEHLTKIRALKIAMEDNQTIKEQLIKRFEPVYIKEYSKVISGEDWYVAVLKNGQLDSVLLSVDDPRARVEFESALKNISTMNFINNDVIRRR